MVVSSIGSVSLYTVQGTDMVPFDTRLVHRSGIVPVPYSSTGLVRVPVLLIQTCCATVRKTVSFIEWYRFGIRSVSLLHWSAYFVYREGAVYLLLFYQLSKLMSCMYA